MRRAWPIVAVALLAGAPPAGAENFDHPGLVHVGKGEWLAPAAAREKGLFEYRGRWFPAAMRRTLEAWEKEDARFRTWEEARKTESKHYRIVSNVPRFVLDLEIKPFLDALYGTYVDVFRRDFGVSGKSANKKTIRIYHGFEEYSRREGEDGRNVPRTNPGFILGNDMLTCYYEDDAPGEFYATVFHEGAHQFVAAVLPAAAFPVWIDEALATYFEGCTYSRATGKVTVGHEPPDRVRHAQAILAGLRKKGQAPRVESLFLSVGRGDFEADHYALSWSFVYFLTHGEEGRNRQGFVKFLQEANGSGARPMGEVFRRATGKTFEEVEGGWVDFVLGLKPAEEPCWVGLKVEPGGRDLRTGDIVLEVDGVVIPSLARFEQAWAARPADRPVEFLVARRTPSPESLFYRTEVVRASVPPGGDLAIEGDFEVPRPFALRD
jgi:hypothetical protein